MKAKATLQCKNKFLEYVYIADNNSHKKTKIKVFCV